MNYTINRPTPVAPPPVSISITVSLVQLDTLADALANFPYGRSRISPTEIGKLVEDLRAIHLEARRV